MFSPTIQFTELTVLFMPLLILLFSVGKNQSWQLKLMLTGQIASAFCAAIGLLAFLLSDRQTIVVGALSFDALSCLLLLVVSLISCVATNFSERYLNGDKSRFAFISLLVLLAQCAAFFICSSNIMLSVVSWHLISLLLWRAVGLKPEAKNAARNVLRHHICSDFFLLLGAVIAVAISGESTFSGIAAEAGKLRTPVYPSGLPAQVSWETVISLLLVLAMAIKSALFPFHGWLLSTLEAPTPLSGFLHAGIVNISAVLAMLTFPLLSAQPTVLYAWGALSALSALVGTLSMSAQTNVKQKLVYSTVGQMGFMSLQCAAGFLPAAVFHMVSHGFFKCQMFLQSGSAVDEGKAKKQWFYGQESSSGLWLFGLLVAALSSVFAFYAFTEHQFDLLTVYSLLVAASLSYSTLPSSARTGTKLNAFLWGCFLLVLAASLLVSRSVEALLHSSSSQTAWLLPFFVFACLLISACLRLKKARGLLDALYVHSLNGFYIGRSSLKNTVSHSKSQTANLLVGAR